MFIREVKGHKEIEHGGGIEGFNTEMAYYPDDKLTVIVLGNLNGGAPGEIAAQLAAVVHGEKVVLPLERKEITLPPAVLQKYVGTYELAPDFNLVVTFENGQLMTQATNQPKIPIYPESETKFFPKAVNAEIEFLTGSKGEITGLILHQGGRDTKGTRR